MSNVTLLIFPFDLDSAKDFAAKAKALNHRVIGASSEIFSADEALVDDFIYLPYITDLTFNANFISTVQTYKITHIYTSHSGVWTHINSLQACAPDRHKYHLCTPNPFEVDWQEYASSYDWAEQVLEDVLAERIAKSSPPRPKLNIGQYAGLHKQFIRIPGQCDERKLLSLTAIAQVVPEGDIVEIGSLYGRSAYVLGWLAEKYDIGNVICVDPWESKKSQGQGKDARVLNTQIAEIDTEKIFKVFIANAVLLNNLGYIRETSVDAIFHYKRFIENGGIESEHLGWLPITGRISILHVDGNHKYEEVWKDIKTWEPHIIPGGWLLLDDYVWSFGNGPQLAGDELIVSDRFDTSFCLGDTLFLRKST